MMTFTKQGRELKIPVQWDGKQWLNSVTDLQLELGFDCEILAQQQQQQQHNVTRTSRVAGWFAGDIGPTWRLYR